MGQPLPEALAGEAGWLETPEGRVRWYAAGEGRPVLLAHSFNAAASAIEIAPLFEALAATRRVVAFDWLGFGRSDRPDVAYDARLYRDELRAMMDFVSPAAPLDVVALSLPAQYAVVAAAESPDRFGRLLLVSPTGFGRFGGRPGAKNAIAWRLLRGTGVGRLLFAVLARRAIVGWFLRQIFAVPARLPDTLARYAWRTAQQPGARFAPLRFITGLLNDGDALAGYRDVAVPTLLLFGDHPRFTDPEAALELVGANASLRLAMIDDAGDLPQWEQREATTETVLAFLE